MTKQSEIEMVVKARAWAIKAHTGQKDKAGKDYFRAHVATVAEGVKGDPIAETVAFLHDTVEDTSITIEDIRTGFPKEVADAVSALTHSKGISYAEYLWYIQQNSIAVKVKLSDLRSNMDLTRLPHAPTEKDLERTRKYKRAYTILSSANGVNAINPYALYDYLLARNWSVKRKSTRKPVLETPDGSAEITVPIDLALDDYETRMANALGVLCSYEGIPLSDAIARIAHWKPAKR
jgi:(p)ppGpp synthase/HD superfamily hydrolase